MAEIEKPTDSISIETGDGDDQIDGLPAIEKNIEKRMRQPCSRKTSTYLYRLYQRCSKSRSS